MHGLLDNSADLRALTAEESARRAASSEAEQALRVRMERAMRFVRETFGAGQELLILLTQLEALPDGMRFLQPCGLYHTLLEEVS